MGAQADEDPDVVQQRGDLEQQAVPRLQAVLVPEVVEQPRREEGDVPGVHGVVLVLLAEGLRPRQHLLAEVRESVGRHPGGRRGHVREQAVAQRHGRHGDALRRGLEQQRAVHEQRGHERLGVHRRQTVPIGEGLFAEPLDLRAELQERVPRHLGHGALAAAGQLPRDEAHVAAERDHELGRSHRDVAGDVPHDVADVPGEQPHAPLDVAGPGPERLAQPHRSQRVHPGILRAVAGQQRDVRRAASDFDDERVARREGGVARQAVTHGDVDEAAFLRRVDDVQPEARLHLHPVEEGVGVRRLADRAGRDGPVPRHAVLVHQALEAIHRVEDGVHRPRPDPPARERLLSEGDAAHGLVEHGRRAARSQFGDDEADGARADVDHGNRLGTRVAGGIRHGWLSRAPLF